MAYRLPEAGGVSSKHVGMDRSCIIGYIRRTYVGFINGQTIKCTCYW